MLYVDTSALLKLYVDEGLSSKVISIIKNQTESLPLTPFHDLELGNAVKLKRFRKEIGEPEMAQIFEAFSRHQQSAVYFRPKMNWSNVFQVSNDLSSTHTSTIGARSLDIIHVASAVSIGAEAFLSCDERQLRLADKTGMTVVQP